MTTSVIISDALKLPVVDKIPRLIWENKHGIKAKGPWGVGQFQLAVIIYKQPVTNVFEELLQLKNIGVIEMSS